MKKNNISGFINISGHPDDWDKVIDTAAKFAHSHAAIGIHPWYIKEVSSNWADKLEQYLQQYPQLFVGECGIDCIRNSALQEQTNIFITQAELARLYNRALIIHAVKADMPFSKLFNKLPPRSIFHSFNGSAQWAKQIQKHGFYLGLNFTILAKKNHLEILSNLDINRILLETDYPYQRKNMPPEYMAQDIINLAQKLAKVHNLTLEKLSQILYQNWLNFTS